MTRTLPLLLPFLLTGCMTMETFDMRAGEAWCDKYFECDDEAEDWIEAANWDGVGECYNDAADGYEEQMEQEEAVACYKKYCEFDVENANECIESIRDIDCDDLEDGDYDLDCDYDDILDCDDEDDLLDCLEDAAENERE